LKKLWQSGDRKKRRSKKEVSEGTRRNTSEKEGEGKKREKEGK